MRNEERRNESWLPGIAFLVLLITTFVGLSNMYFKDVVEIYKNGTASEDFVDLLGITLLIWGICMVALFAFGSGHEGTRAGNRMMANALACVAVVIICLLVGFLCMGVYNKASGIAFAILQIAKIYGYIRAFFFWILY